MAPDASALQEMLNPDVWSVLDSIWPSEGPLSPLTSVHSWAALLLAPSFCQKVSPGVEPHLTQWAASDSKPIDFLETAPQLASILESVPVQEVLAGLGLFAADLAAPQRFLEAIHAAWLAEDLEAVYRAASESPTFSFPGLRSAILERRNRQWAPLISSRLSASERTLIAVGALHFAGPNNIVQLLGRKVEPVSTAG
jgi:uncharacterized protein